MREYGKIATRFWTDPRIIGLPPHAKLVATYLMTGVETSLIGCFRCVPHHLSANGVLPPRDADKSFAALAAAEFMEYDAEAGVVYLPRWFRYNPICNGSSGKAALKAVLALPDSPLIAKVINDLRPFDRFMPDKWEDKCRHMCRDTSRPSHSHSHSHSDSHTQGKKVSSAPDADPSAWIDELKSKADGTPPAIVDAYAAACLRACAEYHDRTGGSFTAKRMATMTRRMGKCSFAAQMAAIEVYVDREAGAKDFRYLCGIADRMNRLSPKELDRDMDKHRARMSGAGLLAEVNE